MMDSLLANRQFCIDNSDRHQTYEEYVFGGIKM